MEGALKQRLIHNGLNSEDTPGKYIPKLSLQPSSVSLSKNNTSWFIHSQLPKMVNQYREGVKVCAVRRRRANTRTETYVLLEPGQDEKFVSEEELRNKLKEYLENWIGKELPPDLARYETTDDAVSFLVKSACELELDGDVGSVQWYEVRLE